MRWTETRREVCKVTCELGRLHLLLSVACGLQIIAGAALIAHRVTIGQSPIERRVWHSSAYRCSTPAKLVPLQAWPHLCNAGMSDVHVTV